MKRLAYTSSLIALVFAAAPAVAQTVAPPAGGTATSSRGAAQDATAVGEVVVTATRRSERLQDVPLSVTAFSQTELTEKGIVGFEGLARETPGVALNQASDNNARITVRGISTNGWGAGLQTTTTIYLDELPLSTIGNTVTLNPNLYDIERVEFLRGPQGTLFGSGSLSGALRILTKSPELSRYDASALVDLGITPDGDGFRQRYNAMVNIPIVRDTLALRLVGFHRNEDGYIDNLGTGVKNSNKLKDDGGRAVLLWKPSDRLSVKLLASYENSDPKDASMTNPKLGDRKRYSTIPDRYTSKIQIYNGTVEYKFDGARLTSSTTYSPAKGLFDVDLAGTFGGAIPFYLYDNYKSKAFVEETRLVSDSGGPLEWVVGGFYLHRDIEVDGEDRTTTAFLNTRGITGLPGVTFAKFGTDARSYELAGFGELTYHLSDTLSLTGGLRYGKYGATVDTFAGFNSLYFVYALTGTRAPLAVTPSAAFTTKYPSASKVSWKGSLTYKPSRDLTAYATVSTGYRTPVYNSRAGSVSTVNPSDLVIPAGAGSDKLINYEVGVKGRWLDGKLAANLAAYYIDWRNIQVQANRLSDSVQFATNIGRASSKGLEAEVVFMPTTHLTLGVNGSLNNAKVTELSQQEAVISGAVKGSRLASPHFQGSIYGSYTYDVGQGTTGFTSFQVEHVGSFPNGFPNSPGTLGKPSPLADFTDSYTYVNVQTGLTSGRLSATLYVENLGNTRAVTYVHPEAFIDSRYSIVRPRTIGLRIGYSL